MLKLPRGTAFTTPEVVKQYLIAKLAGYEHEVFAGLFLDTPLDPFNGEPLRWRETEDGLVIYSVGPHGDYAGDALDEGRPRKDDFRVVEFRLWNVNRRRQAAADVKR